MRYCDDDNDDDDDDDNNWQKNCTARSDRCKLTNWKQGSIHMKLTCISEFLLI